MANASEQGANVGQDFTRPLGRVDLRWTYQNQVDNQEYDEVTLRLEQPFRLSEQWTFNTRFNLPGIYKNLPNSGEHEWGFGDLDVQTALIRKFTERYSMGGGVRTIVPTASEERFGTGKYRLLVGGGLRAMLPEISSGSFIAPQLQYDFDVAGDKARVGISKLRILPTLNLGLPQDQFLTFLSSGDLRYDFNSQKWFVPVDVTYGKRWNNLIASLQASYPIVDDLKLYEFKTELRIGYFF
jgi:hypothetical protein